MSQCVIVKKNAKATEALRDSLEKVTSPLLLWVKRVVPGSIGVIIIFRVNNHMCGWRFLYSHQSGVRHHK